MSHYKSVTVSDIAKRLSQNYYPQIGGARRAVGRSKLSASDKASAYKLVDAHFANARKAQVTKAQALVARAPREATPRALDFCLAALALMNDPKAAQWVELFELATRDGHSQAYTVTYLKTVMEAVHGRA